MNIIFFESFCLYIFLNLFTTLLGFCSVWKKEKPQTSKPLNVIVLQFESIFFYDITKGFKIKNNIFLVLLDFISVRNKNNRKYKPVINTVQY